MINLALVLINDGWLSNQYGASHQAYEIQVSSLTRSLAQMEEQLRLANEDRVSYRAHKVQKTWKSMSIFWIYPPYLYKERAYSYHAEFEICKECFWKSF